MDSYILAALVTATATLVAAVLTPFIQWALHSVPSKKCPNETRDRIYRIGFFCFAGILTSGFVLTIALFLNAASRYKMITPDFGYVIRLPLQSNSSMYIKHQKNLAFPKTLMWLSPKTVELSANKYHKQDTNLLQAFTAEISRPVPIPKECIYLESHLRPMNSWSGFMLCKYFGVFSVDLSQKSEMLLILNSEANDIIEIGFKDRESNETKLKLPVKTGWHGYVIPTADFHCVNKKRVSLFVFAHSSAISTALDNKFWIAYIGLR
ncbi:MAG: hypothetical protein PHY02_05275 [Phycisphaerae bacterium]|nr:hypothetical protein [Phycisphaerae bacterium]